MTSFIARKTLAGGIVAGMLLGSSIGASPLAATYAASSHATKNYNSRDDGYSITYPSSWKLIPKVDTKTIGKVERGIASSGMQIISPDDLAVAGSLVKSSATSSAKVKSTVGALITENAKIIGTLHWDTRTINGVTFVEAGVTEVVSGSVQGSVHILGASHGRRTYYFLGAAVLGQKSSAAHQGEIASMLNSTRLM